MPRRFQFDLKWLLLIVGAVAAFLGVIRVNWGSMLLPVAVAAGGVTCVFYGARSIEQNDIAARSVLAVLAGVLLIFAGMFGALAVQALLE